MRVQKLWITTAIVVDSWKWTFGPFTQKYYLFVSKILLDKVFEKPLFPPSMLKWIISLR